MEDAGVEAGADDRRVREATGAAAQEFVHELRLDLVLHDTGLHELQDAVETRLGDVARALHLVDLRGLLQGADGMQNGRAALDFVVGVFGAKGRVFSVRAGLDRKAGPRVLVVVEVERLGLGHQAVERPFERRRPLDVGDARLGGGLGFGEFGPLPNRELLVGFQGEQNLTVRRVVGVREEEQHRLFLVDPAQVEDVRVLLERQGAVRARGVDVVAEKQGEATGLHLLHERFSVPGVEVGGEFLVPHAPKVQRALPSQHERTHFHLQRPQTRRPLPPRPPRRQPPVPERRRAAHGGKRRERQRRTRFGIGPQRQLQGV